MPGRTSVRACRKTAAVEKETPAEPLRKSATTAAKSRTASTRSSANAVQIPEEGDVTSLRQRICGAFADAQNSPGTHRKLVVTLRKIQEVCCYEPEKPYKQIFEEDYDESEFNEEVVRCVVRVLAIKKSEPVGDRLVRFLGLFLKHAGEKDNAIFRSSDLETEAFPETPTSRLTSQILSTSIQVMSAKDKVIRYRATQIVAHIVNTLDSIDDEIFQVVRLSLLKRLRDKESTVRVQAVLGLGRLADEGEDGEDDDDSDDEVAGGVLRKLRDALQHDPSADVRRALLLNLPFTPGTLPFLLERARDLDAATRRALYSRLLPALGDFRHLSLTHREKLLRWGLRDRDENVRKATARLFRERWIEDCARPRGQEMEEGEGGQAAAQDAAEPSTEALLELLERIDMLNSGVETGIAHEAMREFWDGRPDYRDFITFEDPYFHELTPESVFVARTFNEYCKKSDDSRLQSQAEDKMPEVTKFAFLLQKHLVHLIELVEQVALNPDDNEAEEDAVQQEFCVEQLLHIALTLDYSDEMGRRKMFSIMRESLAIAELPEECTRLVIECLRAVCSKDSAGEQEFCSIVLEAVAEVHDTIMGEEMSQADVDESFHSARSEVSGDATPTKAKKKRTPAEDESEVDEEKAVREIMVNMKCLHIAQCMLQNVQCDLEQNGHLVTMLNTLVVPAVRSQEAPIRERGLICLGLCCLLSKNLAHENLVLFLHCFLKGHSALQVIALQIITDILSSHPSLLVANQPSASATDSPTKTSSEDPAALLKSVHKVFSKSLRVPDAAVQTTGATSLSKLMLQGTIRDSDLLKQLVLCYFDPETSANPSLRQALSYFLPVYCHSRLRNSVALARVAVGVLHACAERADELEEEEEMVGLNLVAGQLVDWADGRKVISLAEGQAAGMGTEEADGHAVLAEELLERLLTPGCTKEEKKTYTSTLSKLTINPTTPSQSLQTLHDLATEALESKAASEAASRNALTKLQTALGKLLAVAPTSSPAAEHGEEEATPPAEADIPLESTEIPLPSTEAEEDEEDNDATEVTSVVGRHRHPAASRDEEDSEEVEEDDGSLTETEGPNATMMTRFTAPPDAEGTVFGDFDDDEDDVDELLDSDDDDLGESTVVGVGARRAIPIRTRGGGGGEESLLDSLLSDDFEDADGIE